MNIHLWWLFILIFLAGLPGQVMPVKGQSGSAVISGLPDTGRFPIIQFHLDVWDAEGNFASLAAENIEVIENGQALAVQSVETVTTGLQVIVAANPSPALAAQVSGLSEYSRLMQALAAWAQVQPAGTPDDFSLSTPTGLFLIRDRDPKKFEQALAEYQPDLVKAQPTLNSISQALDLATDPLGRPLMKRSILYITAALPASQSAALPDLAVRAQQIGVQVNVWLVGAAANSAEGTPDPLQQFAESTGGKYFRIPPSAPLPEVEPIFQPYRQTYSVQYRSAINKSGTNSLSVRVQSASNGVLSAEQRFNLMVEPPNPIFLSPPVQVRRSWVFSAQKSEVARLNPDTVPINILIEFPDQHTRAIRATRLYVDGSLVAENVAEPFDRFDWSIASVEIPTRSLLRVEVLDEIELSGTSSDIPVEILVDQPAKASLFDRLSERGMIAVLAIVAAGATLALILSLTNTQRRLRWKRQQIYKKLQKDPVTQPVPVKPISQRKGWNWFLQLWKRPEKKLRPAVIKAQEREPDAPARLVALDENEQPVTGGIISLSRREITLGSDPRRATQPLNSPTVDGLHARLYRKDGQEFYLADQNSTAGTWINYAPVTATGAHLEHGDLIHIGKVLFRFELTDLSKVAPSEVKIVNLEQTHGPQ